MGMIIVSPRINVEQLAKLLAPPGENRGWPNMRFESGLLYLAIKGEHTRQRIIFVVSVRFDEMKSRFETCTTIN